ncbi:MAG TPA: hypothetical protein VFY59_11130 [Rubrobacter sp.]|nr:hypothetical protein [Rubrobacter sp.]
MPAAVRPTPDPSGTVAIRSAGLVEFRAKLGYRSADEVPRGPTLGAPPSGARLSVVETDDGATREILGEILALSEADLGRALEGVLRSLTIAAALTDAVLETSAARVVPVRTAPAGPLQTLALDVLEAGFRVRFAPTWTPLSEGELGLGVGNDEGNLRAIFGAHLPWSMVGTGVAPGGSTAQYFGEEEL